MTASVSLTESGVFAALRTVLLGWLPSGVEVIRAQGNRVPEPESADFVTMLPVFRQRLATNTTAFVDGFSMGQPGTRSDLTPTLFNVQVDVHGPASGENAQIIVALFRSDAASSAFLASSADVQPLYCSDPRQSPFSNGEQQVEEHWSVDLSLQANIAVTTPQDFAGAVSVSALAADLILVP